MATARKPALYWKSGVGVEPMAQVVLTPVPNPSGLAPRTSSGKGGLRCPSLAVPASCPLLLVAL